MGTLIEERQSPSRRAAPHRGQNESMAPVLHAALTLHPHALRAISGATVAYVFAQSSKQYLRYILGFRAGGVFITAGREKVL